MNPDGMTPPNTRIARGAGIAACLLSLPALVPLIADEPSVWRGVLAGAALLAFLILFFAVIRGRMRPRPVRVVLPVYGALLAIATALAAADDPSWTILLYYCVAIAGMRLPPRLGVAGIALAAALGVVTGGSDPWGVGLSLLGIGAAMTALGATFRANRELMEARAEVARLAVENERVRFARDLHDLLGHSLSVVSLKAQLARRSLPGDPERAASEVADIETVTREALRQVRAAVGGYHSPGLDAELAGARTALDAAGIAVTVEHPEVDLPAAVEAALAWTVREATTNVIRHSGARTSAIRVVPALREASVEVLDDGRGTAAPADSGHGLEGLRSRLREAGGILEAGPRADGPGFRVRAVVPLS